MRRTLINRAKMPIKHILVCEDRVLMQAQIATHLSEILEDQGEVDVSFVRGGFEGIAITLKCKVDLIILDHDMPNGDGAGFLRLLRECGDETPVITASGIHTNNQRLMDLGADYLFDKIQIINGEADELILKLLR